MSGRTCNQTRKIWFQHNSLVLTLQQLLALKRRHFGHRIKNENGTKQPKTKLTKSSRLCLQRKQKLRPWHLLFQLDLSTFLALMTLRYETCSVQSVQYLKTLTGKTVHRKRRNINGCSGRKYRAVERSQIYYQCFGGIHSHC